MKILLLLWAFVGAPAAFADSVGGNGWERLSALRIGERITVVQIDHKERTGEFVRFSPDALVLRVGAQETSIGRPDVWRVVSRTRSHRLRNALIGVGIGLGVSLAADRSLGAYLNNEVGYSDAAKAAIWLLPPALFGGIGAAVAGHPTIYEAPRR